MMRTLFATLLTLALAAPLGGQASSTVRMERLLDRLVGEWRMSGNVRGEPTEYSLVGTRVLQGRFVELHMRDVTEPTAYEARVFIGVDSSGSRYIAHWLDSFGAAYSIPHGTGEARGDTLLLTFPYPDGLFRDTFVYDSLTATWHFRLDTTDSTGVWRMFAEYQVHQD